MNRAVLIRILCLGLLAPAPASRAETFDFPRDHGGHPDFDHERWTVSGQVVTDAGHWYAYQFIFWRISLLDDGSPVGNAWEVRSLYPAAIAISDLTSERFHYRDRLERTGLGTAGAEVGTMDLWTRGWHAQFGDSALSLFALDSGLGFCLELDPVRDVVAEPAHDEPRRADRSDSLGFHYALPGLSTEGDLYVDGDTLSVSGLSWVDHIYGNGLLADDEIGWDRLNVQFRDGSAISVYRVRNRFDALDRRMGGVYSSASGVCVPLADLRFRFHPSGIWRWTVTETGATYPLRWRLEIPSLGLSLGIDAHIADQTLSVWRTHGTEFWRGSVGVEGLRGNQRINGAGFLEMSGYAGEFPPTITWRRSVAALPPR